VLMVGNDRWPMPIPLVQHGAGWQFDTERGKDEILARRIGRNELSAIEVCRAVVDAQAEYVAQDNSGRGAGEYAARFVSAIGKRDGLFWPALAGQPESPLGPLVAEAAKEGYSRSGDPSRRQAYHGYYYRMLAAQGAAATGGAMSYLVDGRMTGGFAVLAEPAVYGVSGMMTFLVARSGVVYQRDLGPDTARVAAAIKAFDPGSGWTVVHD